MQQTEWAPHPAGIAGCGVGGVLMAIAAVTLVTDPPGRVIAGIAAVGLIVFAGASWRARPKLAITTDGLVVRGWLRTQLLRRDVIEIIRIIRVPSARPQSAPTGNRNRQRGTAHPVPLGPGRRPVGRAGRPHRGGLRRLSIASAALAAARVRIVPSGDGDRLDGDRVGRPVAAVGGRRGDGVDDPLRVGVDDLAEDRVFPVQVWRRADGDEEL